MDRTSWVDAKLRGPCPGYFALVIATGSFPNGLFLVGPRPLSQALLAVSLGAYPALLVVTDSSTCAVTTNSRTVSGSSRSRSGSC